jgi:uncharacterized repeat protein (TIGR02543 family)
MSKQKKSRISRIGILLTMAMAFAMVLGPATSAIAVGLDSYIDPVLSNANITGDVLSVTVSDGDTGEIAVPDADIYVYHTSDYVANVSDFQALIDAGLSPVDSSEVHTGDMIAGNAAYSVVSFTFNGSIKEQNYDASGNPYGSERDNGTFSFAKQTGSYIIRAITGGQTPASHDTDELAYSDVIHLAVEALDADAGADQTILPGGGATLDATASSGGLGTYSYEWKDDANNPVGSSDTVTVYPSDDTTYTVEVTDQMGNTDTDTVTVDVDIYGFSPVTVDGTLMKSTLSMDSVPNYFDQYKTYLLKGSDVGSVQIGDTPATLPPGVTAIAMSGSPSDGTEYAYDLSSPYEANKYRYALGGRMSGDTFEAVALSDVLTVEALTVDAGSDQIIISGFSATLTAVPTGGFDPISYLWSPGGATTASTIESPLSDTTYTVTATDSLGAIATDDVTVTVRPRPAEVWVDDDYTDSAPNDGHEWGYDAYDNIDKAIDVVASGGTIHIASGDYDFRDDGVTPQRYILIDKTVTIEGEELDKDTTILSNNDGSGYHGFFINAENVTIKNLTFKNFRYGGGDGSPGHGTAIFVGDNISSPHDYTYTCSGLRIENVVFDNVGYGFVARGVYDLNGSIDGAPSWTGVDNVATSSGITIEGCSFSNINYKATYFEKGSGITINNCSFDTVGLGYKTGSAIDVNLKAGDYAGVEITNNTFNNCGSNVPGYAYTSSFAVTVKARGTGNDRADYKLHPASIDSITITGNVFTGSNTYDLALGEPGKEIWLCGKADETDYDITVSGNGFTSPIINYCELNQMLLLVYGDNTGIDDRANRIEDPGYIKFLCSVSFDSQGGSAVPDVTAIEDFTFSRPSTPTKAGYHLDGWYKERGGVNKWDFAADTAIPNLTLYAKWNINEYTVTFDSQGGSAVGSVTADYGTLISKPADPVKDGYTFGGWYMDKECTDAWDFVSHDVKSDTTLYAKWTENLPVGRLFVLGGTGTSPSPSPSPSPSATPEPTPTPTPEVIEDETPPAGSPSPSGEELGDGDVPAGGANVKGGGSIFASWWFWLLAAGGAVGLLLFLLWIFGKKGKAGMPH